MEFLARSLSLERTNELPGNSDELEQEWRLALWAAPDRDHR
jgi:hypothetical protein